MNQRITIKQGDTRNAISTPLLKNGKPVDLTGCTVLFYMEGKVSGGHALVLDPISNSVAFPCEDNMVNETRMFKAEFKVIYPDGRKDTFPNNEYISIHIMSGVN